MQSPAPLLANPLPTPRAARMRNRRTYRTELSCWNLAWPHRNIAKVKLLLIEQILVSNNLHEVEILSEEGVLLDLSLYPALDLLTGFKWLLFLFDLEPVTVFVLCHFVGFLIVVGLEVV